MIVVVGAGIAGLRVAQLLRDVDEEVVVLEASATPGGRVRSVRDADGRLEYEAGPWRVPETHARALARLRAHGIRLAPLATPTPPSAPPVPVRPGLSIWDVHALETFGGDPRRADEADLATGYADQTAAASGSAPYTTSARRYQIAPDGLDALPAAMAAGLDVRYEHRVVDVTDGGRRVHVRRRAGHNAFETVVLECAALVACVPPHVCREWSALWEHARSTLCAVEGGPLQHVYARLPGRIVTGHARRPDSTLAQVVASQYDNDWHQVSYSGGRVARLWAHLRAQSVDRFRHALARALRAVGVTLRDADEVRAHHWPCAYHHWRPVPDFDLARAVAVSVRPNPVALPTVFLAGEALSSYQAWMEGALETAELAAAAVRDVRALRDVPPSAPSAFATTLSVEGRELDVTRWLASHPGGRAALLNHVGEDVTELMRHVGHSDDAWAVVHALKRP